MQPVEADCHGNACVCRAGDRRRQASLAFDGVVSKTHRRSESLSYLIITQAAEFPNNKSRQAALAATPASHHGLLRDSEITPESLKAFVGSEIVHLRIGAERIQPRGVLGRGSLDLGERLFALIERDAQNGHEERIHIL